MAEQSSIPEAVNVEVNNRTAEIAASAAAQVDQANKDAEAIARAAASTELGMRLNSLEGNVQSWRTEQEANLARIREEQAASLASIQAMLAQRAPPSSETTVVTTPVVDPKAEATGQGELGKPGEPMETPPPPKPTESPPASPPARKRVLL
jgi:hypothetical protein